MAPVLHMLAGEPGEDNPKLRKAVCRLTVYVADHCMERFLCRYYKGGVSGDGQNGRFTPQT